MFRCFYFFKLRSSFLHEERGGSEALIHRMVRWGLQVNIHTTSFIKINFKDPRICFYDYFYTAFCTGRTYMNGLKRGLKY
jgi:hypothetical protein